MFRWNLPPGLIAEWPGSFTCHCGYTGAERAPNKSQHTKLTLEKKILPPLPPGFELATFRSRVWRCYQQAILASRIGDGFILLVNKLQKFIKLRYDCARYARNKKYLPTHPTPPHPTPQPQPSIIFLGIPTQRLRIGLADGFLGQILTITRHFPEDQRFC